MTEGNRIQSFLQEGGIDWRRPISWFVERYGVTRCAWLDIDVVLIADAADLVPGLLRPPEFHYRPDWAAALPPLEFCGQVSVSARWADNLLAALAPLERSLGAPAPYDTSNTRGWRWREGDSQARILSWPPDLQHPSTNLMHERDPRTRSSCHLTVATGFRPCCSAAERALLAAFAPIDRLPGPQIVDPLIRDRFSQYKLEYLRVPPDGFDHLRGQIGRSGDALIFVTDVLYIAPLAEVKAVRLSRCRPARGGGYGRAELICASAAAGGHEKVLTLGDHARTDGLDDWAPRIAKALGVPLEIEEFDDD